MTKEIRSQNVHNRFIGGIVSEAQKEEIYGHEGNTYLLHKHVLVQG